MKSLLESIFSQKSDISSGIKNNLWKGWDEAIKHIDKLMGNIWIDWDPDNDDNILAFTYPGSKEYDMEFFYEGRSGSIDIQMRSRGGIHRNWRLKIYQVEGSPKAALKKVAEAFHNHPDIFLTEIIDPKEFILQGMDWKDFEKQYIKK